MFKEKKKILSSTPRYTVFFDKFAHVLEKANSMFPI